MTLLQIRNLALAWLDDEESGYFTEDQMNRFINMALREAQKILIQSFENRFIKIVTTSTVVDQDRYLLPDDCLKLNLVELVTSGTGTQEELNRLAFTTLSQKNRGISKTGVPSTYMFIDDEVLLRPYPDAVYTLRLYYTYRVPELSTDQDIPDIPTEYHEYLALRAAKFGFLKDSRDTAQLDVELARYTDDMKKDAENRNLDSARDIVRTTSDSLDPLF